MRGAPSDRGVVTVVVVDLGRRRTDDGPTIDAMLAEAAGHGGWAVEARHVDGPVAAFVDPRAAVSFALAVQRMSVGPDALARAGIDAGELPPNSRATAGSIVEIAAAIARSALPGEVLVTDVVRQLASSTPAVEFVEHGSRRLDGERRTLWRATRGPSRGTVGGTIGMVTELALVDKTIDGLARGVGALLAVEGRPGEGKTHLATEAAARAAPLGIEVITFTADELVRRPGGLTHALVRAATSAKATPWRRRLEDLVGDVGGGVDDDMSSSIVDASIDLVDVLAGMHPVLIVAEDLHWADALTMAVVSALARRAATSRFVVMATFRPAPRPRGLDRLLDILDEQRGHLIRREPMSEVDVVAFAASLIGAAPGEDLRQRLVAANGNPLIVKELVRCLDDDGAILIRGGVATVHGVATPSGLHEALLRRLSWLPAETNEMLRLASLFGKSFTLRDVASISGRSVVEVAAQLHDAARSGFLSGSGEHLSFTHDLVREAIYADMLPAARRELHRAAAVALTDSGAPLMEIAQQFATGASVGDLEAVGWLEHAADDTFAMSPSTGIDLLSRALELAPPRWERRSELQAKLLDPLVWCGRLDESEAMARAMLETAPNPAVEFLAWRGLAAVHGNRGAAADAVAALDRALAVPDAPIDECVRLRCMSALQTVFCGTATVGEAAESCRQQLRAVDAASSSDAATTNATIHQTLGLLLAMAGDPTGSCAHLAAASELLAVGAAAPNSYLVPDVYRALSLLALDPAGAARLADDASRRRGREPTSIAMPLAHMAAGRAHLAMGDVDRAASELDAGLTIVDEDGGRFALLLLLALRARIAMRRGEHAPARALVDRGLGHITDHGAVLGTDWLLGVHAELLAIEGDHSEALAVAAMVWSQMAPIRFFYNYEDTGLALTRLAVRQGQPSLAAAIAAEMDEGARRHDTDAARAAAAWCAGLAADDLDALIAAVELYRGTPLQLHRADCCADAGDSASRRGDSRAAIALLEEAIAIADACDCAGDRDRYNSALAGLGVRRRTRARPNHGWESLTAAELVVCGHLAEGLSNVEIGERLVVSRRTVESHLAHVYTKLGYSSRTQLATEYVRRDAAR